MGTSSNIVGTVSLRPDGPSTAILAPVGYLGGKLFDTYRACVEGAKYDGDRKCNVATLDKLPGIVARLKAENFKVQGPKELHDQIAALKASQEHDSNVANLRLAALAEQLKAQGLTLYPFQQEGVQRLAPSYGMLLADDMGLGKTIQALAALPANARAVIVCPKVAKGTWREEAAKWRSDLRVTTLSGRGSFRWPEVGELIITNYEILPYEGPGTGPAKAAPEGVVLVADEAHALKTSKSKRTQSFRAMAAHVTKNKGRAWALTATPLLNHPPELWSLLNALGLAQAVFGSYKKFEELFGAYKAKFGTVWGKPSEDVAPRLARVMIRRLKKDVLPQLPSKTHRTLPIEISTLAHASIDQEWARTPQGAVLPGGDELPDFQDFSRLRAELASVKIPALLQLVAEYEAQEEPVIVFSAHREPVDQFLLREGWATITGDTKEEVRANIARDFQAGHLKGIAGTIQAMGTALTLTRAHEVIFVDRLWTPKLNEQAEDRVLRIGQKNAVVITSLVSQHVLDRHLHNILMRKQRLVAATLGEEM
jgi:SWI/SNF-related matrix-associated actin-dependent regulator of chromatin subfamily A-like protein 1